MLALRHIPLFIVWFFSTSNLVCTPITTELDKYPTSVTTVERLGFEPSSYKFMYPKHLPCSKPDWARPILQEEKTGFEPAEQLRPVVFKTTSINQTPTPLQIYYSGKYWIRTSGKFPYSCFLDKRLKPLGQLSIIYF